MLFFIVKCEAKKRLTLPRFLCSRFLKPLLLESSSLERRDVLTQMTSGELAHLFHFLTRGVVPRDMDEKARAGEQEGEKPYSEDIHGLVR